MVKIKYQYVTLSIIILGLLFLIKNTISPIYSIVGMFNIGTISQENKNLKAKVIELTEKKYDVAVLENENKILKEELSIRSDRHDMVGANVIGKNPVLESGSIIINRGKNDGIEVGKSVIFHNFLVGTIEEAKENISSVRLISSSRTLIPVTIVEAGTSGLLKSGLDGIVVESVLIDKKISIGDKIITGGVEGNPSSNIFIGEVSEIVSSPSDIYQTLKVKSPIDFANLQILFVQK